jgi:hypothetical protein
MPGTSHMKGEPSMRELTRFNRSTNKVGIIKIDMNQN